MRRKREISKGFVLEWRFLKFFERRRDFNKKGDRNSSTFFLFLVSSF